MPARLVIALLAVGVLGGCKKKDILSDPGEHGRLQHLAQNLEQAFGTRALPHIEEPDNFADRLNNWDDFRECLIRTYVARRREHDAAIGLGNRRATRHASVGDEAVEECAVQAAIAGNDPTFCQRLETDYRGPSGERAAPALRCWDARARLLGHPEECPLVWLAVEGFARNPECLAVARRDPSPCFFAESPIRCRALVNNSADSCHGPDAPADCQAAVAFWRSTVPAGSGARLFNEAELGSADGPRFELNFLSNQDDQARLQLRAPPSALGISWPAGSGEGLPTPPGASGMWPHTTPTKAAQIAFAGPQHAVKLLFHNAGLTTGTLPLSPPGEHAPATLMIRLTVGDKVRQCAPAPGGQGSFSFSTTAPAGLPGGFVTGKLDARNLGCDDGSTATVNGVFKVAVLDQR